MNYEVIKYTSKGKYFIDGQLSKRKAYDMCINLMEVDRQERNTGITYKVINADTHRVAYEVSI